MKCENVMYYIFNFIFMTFPVLFLKICIFEVVTFSPQTINSIFSVVVCIYKIYVFDEAFFLYSNCSYDVGCNCTNCCYDKDIDPSNKVKLQQIFFLSFTNTCHIHELI